SLARLVSLARYTYPMPPAPSADWMLYGPNRVPAVSRIALAYCVHVGWHAGPPAHRLPLPIGQRPPGPLEWAESEMAQPDRADRQAEEPHPEHDVIELIPLQLPKQPQAGRIEDQRVDDRMRDVVRERHLPDGGEAIGQPLHPRALGEQDDDRGMPQRHRHAADFVRHIPERGRDDIEVRREHAPCRHRVEWDAERITSDRQPRIEPGAALPLQDAQLEQRHADQHQRPDINTARKIDGREV